MPPAQPVDEAPITDAGGTAAVAAAVATSPPPNSEGPNPAAEPGGGSNGSGNGGAAAKPPAAAAGQGPSLQLPGLTGVPKLASSANDLAQLHTLSGVDWESLLRELDQVCVGVGL